MREPLEKRWTGQELSLLRDYAASVVAESLDDAQGGAGFSLHVFNLAP